MRVLHVQKVNGIGGSERHLLTLLPALVAAGLSLRMLVAGEGDCGRFVDALARCGIDRVVVPTGPDLNPALSLRILREIRRFRPDVVHTHLVHADVHGQLAAAAARVPAVSSVHSTHRFYTREPVRSAERAAGATARRTIAISEHVRAFLTEHRLRRPGRIDVVPYGIDVAIWTATAERHAAARRRFGLVDDEIAVAIASRLVPSKGHDTLLQAYGRAHTELPALRLLIAGDGELRVELEARARQLGLKDVTFLGFVADVPSLMAACDVLVFPTLSSLGEGFGLAALEAMATGRPVVATRVGSLPEVVQDGTTGLLVRDGDADELAKALVRLAQDGALRRRMGDEGRRRALEAFSINRMSCDTIGVYEASLR